MSGESATMLVCSRCGQERPVSEFDPRFVRKNVRINCTACRVSPRKPESPEERERREAAAQRQREIWEAERQRQRELEEYTQDLHAFGQARQTRLAARGITDRDERLNIWAVETHFHRTNYYRRIGRCARTWPEVRRLWLALDPPYVAAEERRRVWPSSALRQVIYERQGGHCAYCDCALLPLSAGRDPTLRRRPDLPELEHRRPYSRGGTTTEENLCYACRECNHLKDIRTDDEFQLYPNDPISHLEMPPFRIAWMLSIEDRYPWDHLSGEDFL